MIPLHHVNYSKMAESSLVQADQVISRKKGRDQQGEVLQRREEDKNQAMVMGFGDYTSKITLNLKTSY